MAAWCAPGCSTSCAEILKDNESLADIAPVVADSGEGRWTALESIELGVPAPVITLALMSRFSSQGGSDYARKLLAMMRAGLRRARRPENARDRHGDGRLRARARRPSAQARRGALGWRFIDADDYHPPANVAKMAAGIPLQDADRWPWLDELNRSCERRTTRCWPARR